MLFTKGTILPIKELRGVSGVRKQTFSDDDKKSKATRRLYCYKNIDIVTNYLSDRHLSILI